MKKIVKFWIIVLFCSIVAAWLKMIFPDLSTAYWGNWKNYSFRNTVGIIVAMPLYEFYYLWWIYFVAMGSYIIFVKNQLYFQSKMSFCIFAGAVFGVLFFVLYTVFSHIYYEYVHSFHDSGSASTAWHSWIKMPGDMQLLLIYGATGAVGGWLYWRWFGPARLKSKEK